MKIKVKAGCRGTENMVDAQRKSLILRLKCNSGVTIKA